MVSVCAEVSDYGKLTVYPEVGIYVTLDEVTGQCHMTSCADLLPTDNTDVSLLVRDTGL